MSNRFKEVHKGADGEVVKSGILSNRLYLYMTEFFAGMAVMAVELGASRLLAPYFSSSQIVWTIIIGTIMIAMALGNIYGGVRTRIQIRTGSIRDWLLLPYGLLRFRFLVNI